MNMTGQVFEGGLKKAGNPDLSTVTKDAIRLSAASEVWRGSYMYLGAAKVESTAFFSLLRFSRALMSLLMELLVLGADDVPTLASVPAVWCRVL